MDKFLQRVIASIITLILLTLVITFSHIPFLQLVFVLFSAAISHFALQEYYHITQMQGYQPLTTLASACTFLYAFAIYLATYSPSFAILPFFVLYGFFLSSFLYFFCKGEHPVLNLAITVFGFIYLTVPLSCAIQINYWNLSDAPFDGRIALAYTILVAKMSDVGGYFGGKTLGKRKLAPYISPNKTVEGALCGWLAAMLTAFCFQLYSPFSLHYNLLFATFISVAAQIGDLAESLIKRDAKVKDSGQIPGLGGVLDMVDSLVFALPLMFLLLKLR